MLEQQSPPLVIYRWVHRESQDFVRLQDPAIRPLMEMYRRAGRKVFLATNSLWDYPNVVMNFLIDGYEGSDRSTAWLRVRTFASLRQLSVSTSNRLDFPHALQRVSARLLPSHNHDLF
jgi:hypothetical protein